MLIITNKRGQSELYGVAILLIVLFAAIIVLMQYMSSSKPENIRGDYADKQSAVNMLYSIANANTNCEGLSITELMQDCAEDMKISCSGKDSCSYLGEEIPFIFRRSFDSWGRRYEFSASGSRNVNNLHFGAYCKDDKRAGFYYIPVYSGKITLRLDVC